MANQEMNETVDVTEGCIWKQLLILCVPIVLTSFFQQSYALINTFIVGRFGGKFALGGIQATASLNELCIGFCVGVGAGCAVIIGQYFGRKDHVRLDRSVHTAMYMAIVGGLFLSVASLLYIDDILEIMGTPSEIMQESLDYSRWYFGAMVFSLVMNMGAAILRAVGAAKIPSIVIGKGCILNIVLDLIFVAGFKMEALGCGIATACSIAFSSYLMCRELARLNPAWRLDFSHPTFDNRLARVMLATGLPLGIQSSVYAISNIIVQSTINSFGTDAVTGWGLAGRLDAFIWMIVEALGVAVTAFSAQNFGAGKYDRMRKGYHVSLTLTVALVGSMSVFLTMFVTPLARIFIDDPQVILYTSTMIQFIAPFYWMYSVVDNTSGAIRGSGESFKPMVLTILGTCIFRVVWLLYIVPLHHTLEMVLVTYPVTWGITAIMFIAYHHFGGWLASAKKRDERRSEIVI